MHKLSKEFKSNANEIMIEFEIHRNTSLFDIYVNSTCVIEYCSKEELNDNDYKMLLEILDFMKERIKE